MKETNFFSLTEAPCEMYPTCDYNSAPGLDHPGSAAMNEAQ